MFGLEISSMVIAQYTLGKEAVELRMKRREAMKASLTPEEFEKWEREELEERRHQDICAAIRATKPDPVEQDDGLGMAKVIIGACIAGAIARD